MGYYRDPYDYSYDETYERVNRYEIVTTYADGKVEKWWEYDEEDAKSYIDHINQSPEDYTDYGVVRVEIIEEVEEVGVIYGSIEAYECGYGDEHIEDVREHTIYTKEF